MEGSVLKRRINMLLLAIPLVIFNEPIIAFINSTFGLEIGDKQVPFALFVLSAVALIPLAGFVESAVEELAELLGPFIGGLLHTTLGNVAELTIGISVLLTVSTGAADIVEGTIAGVIIRNSLLFLGVSTLFGAARNGKMKFSAENASEYSTVFALAVIGLSLPTVASKFLLEHEELRPVFDLPVSALLAIVLLVSYLAYVGFAVFRFNEGYNLVELRAEKRQARREQRELRRHRHDAAYEPLVTGTDQQALFAEERESALKHERVYAKAGLLEHKRRQREKRGEQRLFHNRPLLRGLVAVLVLGIATTGVAAMSEHFAGSVEEIVQNFTVLKHYEFFLGLILIPLLAGVVELYGSVGAARENRMEITMAVTAGATIQMILLVVPILVLVGLNTGHPIPLQFSPLEIITFGAATFIFMLLSRDGESTWLEGAQLCTLWALVAIVAGFVTGG